MLGRITQRSIAMNSLTNLQINQNRTAKLQEQITSGSSLTKGSDDSVRAAAALRLNGEIALNGDYGRNLSDARNVMDSQESALNSTVDRLQRVRELAVGAVNGTLDANGRAAYASEIREIRNTILGDANTNYAGRAVFGGTTDSTVAYAAATPPATGYVTHDDGGTVTRTISAGVTVTVNTPGASVFGDATSNVFDELDRLADDIAAGTYGAGSAVDVATIDGRISAATNAMATIGAKQNQVDHAEDVNTSQLQYLQAQLEDATGVDPAKAYLEFTQQNVAYQAALQVTAKTVQTSLMDFLR
ncbi:flagellar hook-associated protein FlgL [Kineococcus rhizosphaerae]|uniref:Flagellar hook-associated protein 3 FlgL n=1 Tax=Kineococcus rhizosphaerae TaxID=559628 RepID=A0A2T0RAR6_9ACTN|nr:flagellar hook-associated protein FlgL [Kineococcus rhizosphaerae]PRY18255.1 flagellar hook-associated protein 3 FlgL [Kineococcus rhizosphaerae]